MPLSFASTKSNAQLASKTAPNSSTASLLNFVPPAMAMSNSNSGSNRHNSSNNSLASSPASFSASAATAARWMATQPHEIPRATCQLFPEYDDSAAATMAYFMSLRTLPSPLSAALLPRVFALDAVRELFGDDALHMHEVAVRTVVHYHNSLPSSTSAATAAAPATAKKPASFVKLARDVAVEGLFTVVINVGAPADLDLVLLRAGAAANASPNALAALEPLLNEQLPTPPQTGAHQVVVVADASSPIAERRTIRMASGAMCVLTAGEGKWLHRSRPVDEDGASTTIMMGLQHRNK